MQSLRARGLAVPDVSLESPAPDPRSRSGDAWLVKPFASGGGHRVRIWRRGTRVPRGCYVQEFIDGSPGSILFVAARGRAVPLGVTRQLIGDGAFGASGYRYCGNILVAGGEDDAVADAASALADAVAAEVALSGVNGIDFMARDGIPHALESNPRGCAPMERDERSFCRCGFCASAPPYLFGALPSFGLARA